MKTVQAAGARPILVTYPVDLNDHGRANAMMRELASEYGIPLVSSWEAAQRVAPRRRVNGIGACIPASRFMPNWFRIWVLWSSAK